MILEVFEDYALEQGPVVQGLYEAVFAEPPYCEGPDDFADFAAGWRRRVEQPGFRLVIASDREPVAMAFGCQLPVDTSWWDGLLVDAPRAVTAEWEGRSFAIYEMAVLPSHRRRGAARAMHDALLRGTRTQRSVLLCRPEAAPARATYASLGYTQVGPIRPYGGAPVYDAMVRPLR